MPPMVSPNAMCAILNDKDLTTVIGNNPPIQATAQQWGNLPACNWNGGGSIEMRPLDDLTSFTPDPVLRTYETPSGTGRVYFVSDGGNGVDLSCSSVITSSMLPEGYEMGLVIDGGAMPSLCEAATPLVEKVLENIMLDERP